MEIVSLYIELTFDRHTIKGKKTTDTGRWSSDRGPFANTPIVHGLWSLYHETLTMALWSWSEVSVNQFPFCKHLTVNNMPFCTCHCDLIVDQWPWSHC